jgi:hypothetical protein
MFGVPKLSANPSFLVVGAIGLGLLLPSGDGGTSGRALGRADRGPLLL